jgi:hypothetical protein
MAASQGHDGSKEKRGAFAATAQRLQRQVARGGGEGSEGLAIIIVR